MIWLTFIRISDSSHGTVGRATGLWVGRYEFESQPSLTFLNFINTMENRDTPALLYMKIFETKILLKPGKAHLRNVPVLGDKKFSTENRESWLPSPTPPPPYAWYFSIPEQIFLKHRRVPSEIFWYCETKDFQQKMVIKDRLLHKIQKSVVKLMFVENLWKLN